VNISAIIITRDEQDKIKSCIQTLDFADEIIVIDNCSKDKTVQNAKQAGAKVYEITGHDFSYLRNIGKEKAKGKWLLYIDADERISKNLSKELLAVMHKNHAKKAYSVVRQNYFFNKKWPKEERMVRFMQKEALVGWQGSLHESPIIAGNIGHLHGLLTHHTHNDLTHMVQKTNEWSQTEAQLRFNNGHPAIAWWRIIRVMTTVFWQNYFEKSGWRAGTVGLIESMYQSFSIFITYAKLWEMQNEHKLIKQYAKNSE
jgi:glycosyltransferase involved in cell wall biosynthesis